MKVTIAALTAPASLNGVSRHAVNLCRSLLESASICRIDLLLGNWQMDILKQTAQFPDARLHVHSLSLTNSSAGRLLWYYRDLPHIVRQLESQVVHFACPAPIHASAFPCPVVLSLHDMYPFEIPQNFGFQKSWFARRIVSQALRKAAAIACVSESTISSLKRTMPSASSKALVIPNVVSPFGCSTCRRFAVVPDTQFVLCVAQHRFNKNIPLALTLFRKAIVRGILPKESLLLIVGIEGPETQAILRRISELGLRGNVLILSGLTDEELRWCYEHSCILLAPSLTEGFGYPVAEAMMVGCPVVCSDIPAFREICNGSCHRVPFGDGAVDGYLRAMREAVSLPRPRPVALPQFSARCLSASLLALYEKITCQANAGFAMLSQSNL